MRSPAHRSSCRVFSDLAQPFLCFPRDIADGFAFAFGFRPLTFMSGANPDAATGVGRWSLRNFNFRRYDNAAALLSWARHSPDLGAAGAKQLLAALFSLFSAAVLRSACRAPGLSTAFPTPRLTG